MSGYFYSATIDFGDTIRTNIDNSGTTSDLFLVKYDSIGTVIWARSFGGSKDDYAINMTLDSLGNCYMIGSFKSDSIAFQSHKYNNKGLTDIFVMKINNSGIVVWAKTIGNSNDEDGLDIKLDNISNLLICGGFRSDTLEFDQIKIAKSTVVTGFVAKYNNSGNVIWVKTLNGIPYSADVDKWNNISIGGEFSDDTLHIDQAILINHSIVTNDVFVAKFNSSGNLIYAKSFGSINTEALNQIKNDSQGNLILVGNFQGPIMNIDTLILTNGNWDTFVAKLDSVGNLVWVKKTLSQGGIYTQVIAVDKFDEILISGYTMSQWITINGVNMMTGTVFGNDEIFTLKFDSNGSSKWANFFGGNYVARPLGNCIDLNNNFYLVGIFGAATIGLCNNLLTNVNPSNGNGFVVTDVFFAKFSNSHQTDVGVRETEFESLKIKIFPNPTNGEVNVFSDILFDEVIVTNILGEKVLEFNEFETKNKFMLSNKGLYFITFKNKKNTFITKICVE